MGIAHLDDIPRREIRLGHLWATWSSPGQAARSDRVGVRRLEVPVGGWTTPAHEHGMEEEIAYVLAGAGIVFFGGRNCAVRRGDCVVFRPNRGTHTFHAPAEPLDLLIFGPRLDDEFVHFPQLGMSLIGGRAVQSEPGTIDGAPIQFVREAEHGPPDLGDGPGERLPCVVNFADVAGQTLERRLVTRTRRDLASAAGSKVTGLKHLEVAPGKEATPMHCHSLEEEIFVVLEGDGALLLSDGSETPVRAGHVVARPAGTGVSHVFRAGEQGMTFLAYGTREPSDICFYPRSKKVLIRGIDLVFRVEAIEDYWDGEP